MVGALPHPFLQELFIDHSTIVALHPGQVSESQGELPSHGFLPDLSLVCIVIRSGV